MLIVVHDRDVHRLLQLFRYKNTPSLDIFQVDAPESGSRALTI